jgi:diphthine-ammonia ligase
MVLPSLALARSFDQSLADNPDKEFNLQTILSLQHLFRVGLQMGVGWFTSTVAYLPAQPCHHLLSTKATIAGNAWSYLHSQDLGENDEEEEEEGNERDLWEEKYLAGMGNYSGSSKERRLPDWEMLAEVGKGNENIPPFFAAEVEELPRGAGIEWHAHMGIVGGSGIVEVSFLFIRPIFK